LRLKDDCEKLVKEKLLKCSLEVPNVATDLDVTVDLTKRTITCAMKVMAPQDKKRSSARVNWLVKQIVKANPEGIYVKALRPGRSEETQALLSVVLLDPEALDSPGNNVVPNAFEVFYMVDLAGRFAGSKIFIDELERAVPRFYEQVGQRLRAWVASPPKIRPRDPVEEDERAYPEGNLVEKRPVVLPAATVDEISDETDDGMQLEDKKFSQLETFVAE
jgi:hypothetical protein